MNTCSFYCDDREDPPYENVSTCALKIISVNYHLLVRGIFKVLKFSKFEAVHGIETIEMENSTFEILIKFA